MKNTNENPSKFLQLSGSAYNHELKPAYLSIDQIRRKISPRVEKLDPEQRSVFKLILALLLAQPSIANQQSI